MPRVLLSRDREVFVDSSEVERIKLERDARSKSIKVGNLEVDHKDIKGFRFDQSQENDFSLSNPAQKAMVLSFERSLKDYQARMKEPPHDLEFYGELYSDFLEKHPVSLKGKPNQERPGFVFNDILGLVHWSNVQFFIDEGAIDNRDGHWVIIGEHSEHGWDFVKYGTMIRLWRFLKLLNERRAAYNLDRQEELDSLVESHESVQEELPF